MTQSYLGNLFYNKAAFKLNSLRRNLSKGWVIKHFEEFQVLCYLLTTTTIPGTKFRGWCSVCFSIFGKLKENLFPIHWSFTDTSNISRVIIANQLQADGCPRREQSGRHLSREKLLECGQYQDGWRGSDISTELGHDMEKGNRSVKRGKGLLGNGLLDLFPELLIFLPHYFQTVIRKLTTILKFW